MKIVLEVPRFSQKPFGCQTYYEQSISALIHERPRSWNIDITTTGLRGLVEHQQRLKKLTLDQGATTHALRIPASFISYVEPIVKLARGRFDITHSMGWGPFLHDSRKYVVTILDLIPLKTEDGDADFRAQNRMLMTKLADRADAIVTISKSSKTDIHELLNVPNDCIHVLPHGFDEKSFKPPASDFKEEWLSLVRELKVESPYLIHIGGNAPRKNVKTLLKAFDQLKARYNIPHKLVLVGVSPNDLQLQSLLRCHSYANEIVCPGYLAQEKLVLLLQGADALIFPSTYEGFGMPPIEAMACGVRVATSNSTSLPEVGGDVAVYFDPLDADDIAAVVYDLISEPADLKKERIRRGISRSQEFRWEKTGQALVELYQHVLSKDT